MSELTWYSRLAVWFGALVLFVQSITGRGLGIVTVLAVVAVAVGFVTFLAGMAAPSFMQHLAVPDSSAVPKHTPAQEGAARLSAAGGATTEADRAQIPKEQAGPKDTLAPTAPGAVEPQAEDSEGGEHPEAAGAVQAQVAHAPTAEGPQSSGTPEVRSEDEAVPAQPPEREPAAMASESGSQEARTSSASVAGPAAGSAAGVRHPTFELSDGDARIGAVCPRCGDTLTVGDVAVTCVVCGTRQHAHCWTANHFHCTAAGCPGHGSLEAPE